MEVFLGSRSCQQSGEDLELQKSGGRMLGSSIKTTGFRHREGWTIWQEDAGTR